MICGWGVWKEARPSVKVRGRALQQTRTGVLIQEASRDCHNPLMKQERSNSNNLLRTNWGNSLVVKWLGLRAFTAKGQGSIPGQGTKIPQAVWCSQKTKQNKKTRYQMLSRIWRKRTLVYDVGSVNWYSHCGNSMEVPQEIKNRITGRLPWRSSG